MDVVRVGRLKGVILISSLFAALFLPIALVGAEGQTSKTISSLGSITPWPRVDITVNTNIMIGVNNLSLGFMLDHEWKSWRDSLARIELARNASFKLVRFFDWKTSSPDPCTYWNESSRIGNFNWTEVDLLVRRIFDIGAEPFITLGSYADGKSRIPSGMAVNPATELPYPESFAAYAKEWVNHFKAVGLPVRFYEIWNEPFFYFYKNWIFNQTKLSYFFELFNVTYTQMHQANSKIMIGNDASLYRVFLNYWVQQGGKLDFFSFHKYDSNGLGESENIALERAEQRYFFTYDYWYGIGDARKIWLQSHGVVLPAINSESNFGASWETGTDPRIQQMVGAVWTALMLRGCILNNIQYSVYYSFESSLSWSRKNSQTGGAGFGMVNEDNNQPWYPYYVQFMVEKNLAVGDLLVKTTSSLNDVRTVAWVHNTTLNVLFINKVDQPRMIALSGLEGELSMMKIDNSVSWETPSIQNSRIMATEPLFVQGYTVGLIQMLTAP